MKILYVTTIGGTMAFFKSFIKMLIDEGHSVDIATNESGSQVSECYREWKCNIYQIQTSRSPLKLGNLKAIKQLKKLVNDNKYDIVHCHTPIAAMCTRLACINLRKQGTRVFYTAHGFHFYKGAPLKNWLLYYPVEKVCSYFTDVLITINQEDFALAKEKMKAKKVVYIPGVGVDVTKFANSVVDIDAKRDEIGVPRDSLVLLSVGELNENKNHEVVIRALAQLDDKNIHYIIAGEGPLDEYLRGLSKQMGVGSQIHLLGYRTDIAELNKISDAFVFPSYREGLGLAAIEAMACGLPLVISDNRGAKSYATNNVNAIVCPVGNDATLYAAAINEILYNCDVRKSMSEYNTNYARIFEINQINQKMIGLYMDTSCSNMYSDE